MRRDCGVQFSSCVVLCTVESSADVTRRVNHKRPVDGLHSCVLRDSVIVRRSKNCDDSACKLCLGNYWQIVDTGL
jgi:hypothetical protein